MKPKGWQLQERKRMKRIMLFTVVLACLLAACAAPTPVAEAPSDLEHAQQTLIDFFSLLHNREYSEAIERFADDADTQFFETARRNNVDVNPDDEVALMEAACTYQLQCMEILNVVNGEQISDTEFTFTVEFANEDGTLFVLGPCCGSDETEMPPVSQFEYRVEMMSSEFFVHGSPVYVP
jgi:hypothetical protein